MTLSKDQFNRYYGQRLKTIRVSQDMGIEELAEKMGVTAPQIHLLERGDSHSLDSAFTAFKLALALDCSVNDLFGVNVEFPEQTTQGVSNL